MPDKISSQPALAQTIGGWQIMFYGLGSMLGAGIYALIGKAAGGLGNAMWLAFLLAMIGALFQPQVRAAALTGLGWVGLVSLGYLRFRPTPPPRRGS